MQVKTGSFTGNGTSQSITGLGFQPDMVWTQPTSEASLCRTSTMPTNLGKVLSGSGDTSTTGITSLDSDGFTVGSGSNANANGATVYWLAVKCDNVDSAVGSYTGNGTSQTITGLAFQPDFVVVMGADTNTRVHWATRVEHPSGQSNGFNTSQSTVNITAFTSDGFTVGAGSGTNQNTTVYHYVALKNASGVFNCFEYNGNNSTDNYNAVTGLSFQPTYAFVKFRTNTVSAVFRHKDHVGDFSMYFTITSGSADLIQAFNSDGIQVGTNTAVNGTSSNNFIGAAFADTSAAADTLTLPFVDTTPTIYGPTVAEQADDSLTLPFLDTTPTIYGPTVAEQPNDSLTLPFIDTSPTLYGPTVAEQANDALTLPFVDTSPTIYGPTVAETTSDTLTLPFIDTSPTIYGPTVAEQPNDSLTLPLVDPTIYGDGAYGEGGYGGGTVIYPPTVAEAGGASDTLTLPFVDTTPTIYGPTVAEQANDALTLPFLDTTPTIYGPTVAEQANDSVTLPFIDTTPTIYALSVAEASTSLKQLISLGVGFGTPIQYAMTGGLDSFILAFEGDEPTQVRLDDRFVAALTGQRRGRRARVAQSRTSVEVLDG